MATVSRSRSPATTPTRVAPRTAASKSPIRPAKKLGDGRNEPSVPIPKFAELCGTLVCELRKQAGTGNCMIQCHFLDLKSLSRQAAIIGETSNPQRQVVRPKLDHGAAKDLRVALQGPNGKSFVELLGICAWSHHAGAPCPRMTIIRAANAVRLAMRKRPSRPPRPNIVATVSFIIIGGVAYAATGGSPCCMYPSERKRCALYMLYRKSLTNLSISI
jgi:hypothetical protein